MKKFLVLTYGYTTPTEEIGKAWMAWFESVGPHLVDRGNPFGRGTEISQSGNRTELDLKSPTPLVGYCILNAESLDAAERLVDSMPVIESVRIYEANSM